MEARKTESSKFFQNWCEKRRTIHLLISKFPTAKTIVPKGFLLSKMHNKPRSHSQTAETSGKW